MTILLWTAIALALIGAANLFVAWRLACLARDLQDEVMEQRILSWEREEDLKSLLNEIREEREASRLAGKEGEKGNE